MGALDRIKNFLKNYKERKMAEDNLDSDMRLHERVEARKLSANERELLRFKKEQREKMIKRELDGYRKRMNDNIWRGKVNNPLYAKNIMKEGVNIFNNQKKLFCGGQNILRQKNIFKK